MWKTPEERRDHARRICRRLTSIINASAPPGLGHWDPAWRAVEGPSGEFLDALDAWTAADSPEGRERVKVAAEDLVRAWKEAGALYSALFGAPHQEQQEVVR